LRELLEGEPLLSIPERNDTGGWHHDPPYAIAGPATPLARGLATSHGLPPTPPEDPTISPEGPGISPEVPAMHEVPATPSEGTVAPAQRWWHCLFPCLAPDTAV
jgi:hypothetical protein